MPPVQRPTIAEVNKMNAAKLKETLKDLIRNLESSENIEPPNSDEHLKLLKEILTEVRNQAAERDALREEIDSLKEANRTLSDTVSQQQRFLESLDAEKRSCNMIVIGVPEEDTPLSDGEGEIAVKRRFP